MDISDRGKLIVNIKKLLDEELWSAIEKNYLNENYTGSITDAVFYIRDIIRDKSHIYLVDGDDLVNQAFGGNIPKIKINKLITKTDKSIQAGLQNSLKGIFGHIRNPRSHDKYEDTVEDAISIILYINYLSKIIGKAKSSFSVEKFIDDVYDEHFEQTITYAKLLVDEIPNKQKEDTFYQLYQSIGKHCQYDYDVPYDQVLKDNHRNLKSLKLVMFELLKSLDSDKNEIIKRISSDLNTLSISIEFYWKISLFVTYWEFLDKRTQLRTRNILQKNTNNWDYAYYKNQVFLDGWKYFDTETKEVFYNNFIKDNTDYILKNDELMYLGNDISLENINQVPYDEIPF